MIVVGVVKMIEFFSTIDGKAEKAETQIATQEIEQRGATYSNAEQCGAT